MKMIVAGSLDRVGRTSPGHVKHGTLRISKIESLEFRKSKSNKTESSKTEKENFAGNFEKRNRGDYSHKGGRQSKNAFCSFEQRDYDFEEVEQFLLKSDPPLGDSS